MDQDGAKAPTLPIPSRRIAGVEHPALLKSLDRGLATFGANADYSKIVKSENPQSSVPLYLRHEDPASGVLASHNAATHNVVLAVTVPRRTGMKRKRGSDGPWEYDSSISALDGADARSVDVALAGVTLRQRNARLLRRKLQDNAGNYNTEVVGLMKHTHRYRGLYDFQQSVHDSEFMAKFTDKILPGELSKLREFRLAPGVAPPPNVDLPPPPFFTTQAHPFPYFYSQNPFIREVVSANDGAVTLVNSTASTAVGGYFLKFDHEPIPTAPPPGLPPVVGRRRNAILARMREAVAARPVWTRRGLVNHLSRATGLAFTENRLKPYFVHVCYQFKGGPWRDTLVRYGVDPRKDPAYRPYQTLLFKLHQQTDRRRASWHSLGPEGRGGGGGGGGGGGDAEPDADAETQTDVGTVPPEPGVTTAPLAPDSRGAAGRQDTHVFDGRSYCDDGKIWQVCDITDPLLAGMLADAPVRPACDLVSTGWYHQGTWAKAKAVMKTKLLAIRFGRRDVVDDDAAAFRRALAIPHATPRLGVRSIKMPVPDLDLTAAEQAQLAARTYHGRPKKRERRRRGVTSFSVPILAQQRTAAATDAGEEAAEAPPRAPDMHVDGPGSSLDQPTQADGADQMEVDEDGDEAEEEEVDEEEEDEEDEEEEEGDEEAEEEDQEEDEDEEEDEEGEDDDEDEEMADRIAVKREILADVDEDNSGRSRRPR